MQTVGTQKNHTTSHAKKKITQPAGTGKNHLTSHHKKNQGTSRRK